MNASKNTNPAGETGKPTKRRPAGPLPIGGMTYLHLTFAIWIAHLFSLGWPGDDKLPRVAVAAGAMVALAAYRSFFNRVTTLEAGSAAYLLVATIAYALAPEVMLDWGSAFGLSMMSTLWVIDMARSRPPLSAQYSVWKVEPGIEQTDGFRWINSVISLTWGCVILCQLLARLAATIWPALHYQMLAIELGLLPPAFVFTAYYPRRGAKRTTAISPALAQRLKGLARSIIAVIAVALATTIVIDSAA